MFKIVRCTGSDREIVDEFDSYEEARDMRVEYEIADPSAAYRLRYPPKSERHRANEWHEQASKHDI